MMSYSYGGGSYGGGYGGGRGGFGGGAGVAGARGQNGACCVAAGEECTACGVGCGGGGAGSGALSYVGTGQGEYIQETNYKYVGFGGDFDVVRPRRDFTCIITSCCLLSLLLLIPLLMWLLSGTSTSQPWDCTVLGTGQGSNMEYDAMWPQAQKDYCCQMVGRGCATTALPETTPQVPPTPFPTPPPTPPRPPPPPAAPAGPVDPYNCAVGQYFSWDGAKQQWCCRIHHICGQPTQPPAPA